MPIAEAAVLIIIAAVTAVVTTVTGAWIGRKMGLGKIAESADVQTTKLVRSLQSRLELAETTAAEAKREAERVERRRQSCEDEIGRLNRRLMLTENELLDLYRRTGEKPPKDLIARNAENLDRT